MCMIQLQNYIMNCWEHILMSTIVYQIQKEKKMERKYKPKNLFLNAYNYDDWFDIKELTDKEESADLSNMSPLEGDEEVKERKEIKILTPNKLLTRLPISPAQTKVGNNSNKLKNEIKHIMYLLHQHNKIAK